MSRVLIGIDDTDNAVSRGTGYHSRRLGRSLATDGVAEVYGITRHQLLFDRRIPYTSHNSSLCLDAEVADERRTDLIEYCRHYLTTQSAPGSDAGLCIAAWDAVSPVVERFGWRAKAEILVLEEAVGLAASESLHLEGLTGDHGGQIGALAAVGLRRGSKDGRVAWRPGLRETTGITTADALLRETGLDAVRDLTGRAIPLNDRIDVTPWPRAVLVDGQAVLLVEPGEPHANYEWRTASKDVLRAY